MKIDAHYLRRFRRNARLTATSLTLTNFAGEAKLEAIAEGAHVRIWILHQLKGIRNDLDWPRVELGVLAGLEAEGEVSRMLLVDAEGVDGALWVGLSVCSQPAFW